eukprot:TRINITY_DN4449_c0_g1_i1.p1 TRINITY_DN4449_c0_g1~~TRINITY_DN4449_c0_g1_i1.p1  ORF type:complete len:564 (+),score=105.78 TRINITY_DN4449_c0_g1_i1:279-1970(+)
MASSPWRVLLWVAAVLAVVAVVALSDGSRSDRIEALGTAFSGKIDEPSSSQLDRLRSLGLLSPAQHAAAVGATRTRRVRGRVAAATAPEPTPPPPAGGPPRGHESAAVRADDDDFSDIGTCGPVDAGVSRGKILFVGFGKRQADNLPPVSASSMGEIFIGTSMARAWEGMGYTSDWLGGGIVRPNGVLDESMTGGEKLKTLNMSEYDLVVSNGIGYFRDNNSAIWNATREGRLDSCRLRGISPFGRVGPKAVLATPMPDGRVAQRWQVLHGHRDACPYHRFAGFHVAGAEGTVAQRERVGLIFGKRARYLSYHPNSKRILSALVDAGFQLHATCTTKCPKCKSKPRFKKQKGSKQGAPQELRDKAKSACQVCKCHVPPGVQNHGLLPPKQFRALLRNSSFFLGLGGPVMGTSAVEALGSGAALINPYNHNANPRPQVLVGRKPTGGLGRPCGSWLSGTTIGEIGFWGTQVDNLAHVGPPHVYNVDLSDTASVVEAAEQSYRRRFASHIPDDYTLRQLQNRLCRVMADSASLCAAPRHPCWESRTCGSVAVGETVTSAKSAAVD